MARWIASYYHPHIGMVIKCSGCEKVTKHQGQSNPKFCPECGAPMENWSSVPDNWGRALDSF